MNYTVHLSLRSTAPILPRKLKAFLDLALADAKAKLPDGEALRGLSDPSYTHIYVYPDEENPQ